MANLGLLQGLGRGLSQGAEMLNRGMAEDRAVAREEERERMRQASIEKRWRVEDSRYADSKAAQQRAENRQDKQDEKADSRYKDEIEYRKNRDKESLDLNRRQLSLAEQQAADRKELERKSRIEQTLGRISSKYEREGEKIDRRFDRLLDVAADDPVKKEALYKERDAAHAAIAEKMSGEMLPALKSFGEDLRGTAFETYIDEIAAMNGSAEDDKARQFLKGSGAIDASGQLIQSTGRLNQSGGSGRGSVVNGIIGDTGQPAPTAAPVKAGLLAPGFIGGFQQSMAGDNDPMSVDYSQITPAQRVSTAGGRAVGYFPGKLRDVAEVANETAIQPAWQWLNSPQKR